MAFTLWKQTKISNALPRRRPELTMRLRPPTRFLTQTIVVLQDFNNSVMRSVSDCQRMKRCKAFEILLLSQRVSAARRRNKLSC